MNKIVYLVLFMSSSNLLSTNVYHVARYGSADELRKLIDEEHKSTTECTWPHLFTPLHFAAAGLNYETVKFLCERNVPVDVRDREGRTPLHYLVIHYLDKMEKNNLPGDEYIRLEKSARQIVRLLTAKDKNIINSKDNDGNTALHYAIGGSNFFLVKVLYHHDALTNIVNNSNQTSLQVLKENKIDLQYRLEQNKEIDKFFFGDIFGDIGDI